MMISILEEDDALIDSTIWMSFSQETVILLLCTQVIYFIIRSVLYYIFLFPYHLYGEIDPILSVAKT